MKLFDLTGQGIGLTGGGGHLGRAMALGLTEAGAVVVICGRRQGPLDQVAREAKRRALSGRLIPVVADIGRIDQIEAMLGTIENAVGQVNGWVNNAYSGAAGKLMEITRQQADATVSGGLTDVLMVTQAVARRMMSGQGGSIVNVSSMYGMVSPQPAAYRTAPEFHNPVAYGPAKAALIQFTRYAACHLAPHAIRVNAISPGPFPRPRVVHEHEAFVEALTVRVPLGRIGRPDELVGAAIYLLSNASSYVTGTNLVVDGGWTAW